MNKRLLAALLVAVSLCSCGCWDKKEFNKISFATAMAVDFADGAYQLTIKVMMPKRESAGDLPVWVVSGSGQSIQDAMDNINKRSPREIYWGHMDVILLGESVLQGEIYQALDFFVRGSEFRRRNYVVATAGKASALLDISPKLAKINSFYFKGLLEDQEDMVENSAVTLNDVLLGLTGGGRDLFIPCLQLQAAQEEVETTAQSQGGGQSSGEKEASGGEEDERRLELKGGALIKNQQLVTWVDDEWVDGYHWIGGNIHRGSLTMPNPMKENAVLSFAIKDSHSRITLERENPLRVKITVTPTLNIAESTVFEQQSEKQLDHKLIDQLLKAVNEKIKGQIENTIAVAQENNVDPFGIGRRLRAYHPALYAELDKENYLRDLDIVVEVKSDLRLALIIN